ncbi:hypothetical protein TPL01_30240 [Sulfuriferula plumbiphila]|uniref:Uncharacterized protein n=1 Tax=Sulfuriferula plumbiphila TaxID=171865 RepID=A0A512LBP1_9PROT|nr:hypothetical protein [Sulfuriferula plumbiphila]BBP04698.1 hypothetical protein SFPGR_21200 [Sulfuriferula plumbiphila]GEP31886.1 hypothetical protein TPL01_30240 [Sulfuriferula plumbiphila]
MHSLAPGHLARLRFDTRQLVTLRALGEYRGKQRLYGAQSPEVLGDLRQIAVVESTESSNRLEGVVVAASRLKSLALKDAASRSRSRQGVAGCRDALGLIHESGERMVVRKNAPIFACYATSWWMRCPPNCKPARPA